jgi:hypothetical protein
VRTPLVAISGADQSLMGAAASEAGFDLYCRKPCTTSELAEVIFTHDKHASTYQISCQTCHHTNGAGDAAKTEQVQRCVACHKESGGDVQNPTTADGDEVDVKLAFHGNRDNTTNQAGCAACHEQRKKGPPLSQCGSCHTAR